MQALCGPTAIVQLQPGASATARRAPAAAAARSAAASPSLPRRASLRAAFAPHRLARGGSARGVRSSAAVVASASDTFVPVLSLDDLPKGSRQAVSASGKSALLFWYREALYAIEPRSPAEGAYSEGFLTARLTQDGCIECPTTKTTFDLKTGEIKAWYPDNPVLRALTPIDTCRPMEVFPVRVESNGTVIAVDFANSNLGAAAAGDMDAERTAWTAPTTSGGANTSVERNNVYGIEPRVYLQDGSEVRDASGKAKVDPATLTIGIVAIAIIAVAGTAVAISKESIIGGVLFWIALLVPVGVYVFRNAEEGDAPPS